MINKLYTTQILLLTTKLIINENLLKYLVSLPINIKYKRFYKYWI